MAATGSVWGIDIGRCALKAIKLRSAPDDKVEVVAFDYVDHAKVLSQPDADRPALIHAALEKFLSRNDVSKDLVVVSVPGQHTLARFTKLPPVAAKRIPDIVRYEADQQIPFDMDEVIWDYQTFQQEGLPDIEVGIFAMKRELIREHLLHFEQASIEPIAVQSGPLAIYNAVHYDGLLGKDTTIILDVGAENTDLVIATPHSLWTRTVPIGGNAFTDALVKSFKLAFSKAETLKRTAATSKYARQIFQAMRPIFADLVQELQRSIGFYSSTHRDANVEKVVALGNAFLLPGLQKYLQQNLGLTVDKPETFQRAIPSAASGNETFKEQFLSFGAAYGLALQGLGLTKVTSNLLPTEIAKQVVWRKKRPAFAAAAACMVLAGGLVWFRQISDMRALAAASEGGETTVKSIEQAETIIDNGPPGTMADRAKAQAVLGAGNLLKKEIGARGAQGKKERDFTEALVKLQQNKSTVAGILEVIHDSMPRPSGALADAATPGEIRQRVLGGQAPPRDQRTEVRIHSLDVTYEPNLKLFKWKSMIEVPPPLNDYNPDAGEPIPGMLVKMTCTTPNASGPTHIRDTVMSSLRSVGRKPQRGFYFDQVILVDGAKLSAESDAPRAGASLAIGGRGTGGKPGGKSGGDELKHIDPVTDEPVDNDWRFEIWAAVVLQNLPDSAGEDDPAGNDRDG